MIPNCKKGDKTDFRNYRGKSSLPAMYKLLSNILLSSLAQYAEEIVRDHRCEFRHNRSATDHIFCIHQILYLRKTWEFIEAVYHLFVDLRKAYDSLRRKVLYECVWMKPNLGRQAFV